MILPFAISALVAAAAGLSLDVPSGQPLQVHEVRVVEPERQILFIGLVAPHLEGDYAIGYERASVDMDHLCEQVGLPLVAKANDIDTDIAEVVLRLMARPISYGETNPDVAQFISAYDVTAGDCQWF